MIHFLLADENNWVPAAIFGGALFVIGLFMMRAHRRAWVEQKSDQALDDQERSHFANRFRRRMQTSAGISLIGAMVAIGDQPIIWNLGALPSTLYWLLVMILACWIGLLAIGDATSIKTYASVTSAKYESQRRQLEQELAELRRKARDDSSD